MMRSTSSGPACARAKSTNRRANCPAFCGSSPSSLTSRTSATPLPTVPWIAVAALVTRSVSAEATPDTGGSRRRWRRRPEGIEQVGGARQLRQQLLHVRGRSDPGDQVEQPGRGRPDGLLGGSEGA